MNGAEKAATNQTAAMLLITVLVLALGGCFEGGGDKEEGEGGGEETAAKETGAGGESTIAGLAVTTFELTPSQDYRVSGTARLTEVPGGVEVTLDAWNLPTQPGTEHIAHIHEGDTCAHHRADNEAPVVYWLDPVYVGQDGTASSTTSLAGLTLSQLFSGLPKYVDVHAELSGEVFPPGVACVDLPLRD